jgi:hypothetical protein
MSLATFRRFNRALDGASSIILASLGLLLSASVAFIGV